MELISYKCPNCGGDVRFDPPSQKYKCEYCLSLFTQEELDACVGSMPGESGKEEHAQIGSMPGESTGAEENARIGSMPGESGEAEENARTGNMPGESTGAEESACIGTVPDDTVLYNCPSCGAQIVTDETTAATFCYYCHNPVVLTGRLKGKYRPDKIIPFAVDKKRALQIFDQWMGRKKYIPKDFYSKDQIEKLTGVYFPYWLYDCKVEGKLEAEATRLTVWSAGNIRYTRTEKFDVSRDGHMDIENVARGALSKANRQLAEGVFPFEMDKLQPFQIGYLSGFMAENRDMDKEQFVSQVEDEVKEFAGTALRSQVSGYDSVNVRRGEATISDAEWKYTLLPVWTLTYNDPRTGKVYYFACNGQTGKVCGVLPVDSRRLMRLFAVVFTPVFLALLAIGYFL